MNYWWKNPPYTVLWIDGMLSHVYDWCDEEIGGFEDTWMVGLGYPNGREFYFKHEEDKVKFILRWL